MIAVAAVVSSAADIMLLTQGLMAASEDLLDLLAVTS